MLANRFLLMMVGIAVGIGCTKKNNQQRTSQAGVVKEDTSEVTKDITASGFKDEASNGRLFQYASLDSVRGENTDYTRLHPKSAEFYGVATTDALEYQHSLDNVKTLRNFTNFQEAVFENELIVAVTEGCREEGFTSIRACLDDGILKSGALVMQPKVPLGSQVNPNDPNHILDVANNTFGLISVKIGTQNAYMGSCAGCHSSVSTMEKQNGQKVVYIDAKGDNSAADIMVSREIAPYLNLAKSKIENENDVIWNSSSRGRAAGLLAAQFKLLRDQHGSAYYATDDHIKEYAKNTSIKRAIDSGWLLAFASIGSASKAHNQWKLDGENELTDEKVAQKTERATLETFLPGGSRENITNAIFASGNPLNIPSRSQRATSLWPTASFSSSEYKFVTMGNFSIEYATIASPEYNDNYTNAQYYLLGATSIAAILPHNYSLTLSQKWLGKNSDEARAEVNSVLRRTLLDNYEEKSTNYYRLRYKQLPRMSKDFARRYQ